jgi:integrase
MGRKRHFGNVRRRESGRWQVRYPGPDGRMRSAPRTFERKVEAERYLSLIEAQLAQGEWIDPARAKVRLRDYAEQWIDQRPGLRPRTLSVYRSLLRRHINSKLGDVPLGKLDTPLIREWRAKLLAAGVSATMAAKAYRLLRAILMTAVNEDRILARNPCRIRGADREQAGERPVLSAAQVIALADAVPSRYRAMILVATFASLRFGEVTALRRSDIDLAAGTVRVARAFGEVRGQGLVAGPPKSVAGARTVAIPSMVVDELRDHMAGHVTGHGLSALVFTGPTGAPIRRGNFNKLVGWHDAVAKLGLPGLHFHDLRHTGNTFAAKSGVGTKDLMGRMGHDSIQAALIYQRATDTGDARIRAALEAEIAGIDEDQADSDDDGDDGAAGVPVPV